MKSANNHFQFGPFLLDRNEWLLLRDGQQITLKPKAFETLLLLVENSGHVLSKDEMLTRLWPDTFVEEANLTNNISSLRKALGDGSEGQKYIQTVPRVGYRFVAAVTEVSSQAPERSKPLPVFARKRRRLLMAPVVVALFLVIAGGWIIRARFSRASEATLPFHERDVVLVTNLDNRTGELLFNGTIESALERELSNSRFVNVLSHERITDILKLMKKPPDSKIDATVGREICLRDRGVRAMLAGRVEKLGKTYVMSVSLVDPATDRTVAVTTEEAANQESIWPAIRRLSNWVRETLGEELPRIRQTSEALEKVTTPSLRALQLYTQAMPLVNQLENGAAEQILRQAVSEDPEFASAYIMLAHMIRNQGKPIAEWGPPSQRAFDLAGRTSERERYFIEGSYYSMRRQYDKAIPIYEALIHQYPDDFWGRNNVAWAYFYVGRWQDHASQLAQAAELRPYDLRINRLAAWNLLETNMSKARLFVQRGASVITPELVLTHPYETAWIQLFNVHDLLVQGDIESAVKELDLCTRKVDSSEGKERDAFALNCGSHYLSLGKLKAAEELYQRVKTHELAHVFFSELFYAAGDKEKLTLHLRKQLKNKSIILDEVLFLVRAGLINEAERLLAEERAKNKQPDIPADLTFNVLEGEIALSRGRINDAILVLQKALPSIRWTNSAFFYLASESLADALERQGHREMALQVLKRASEARAISYDNMSSSGAYWLRVEWRLAQLCRKLGLIADAQKIEGELFRTLAYADPDHPILVSLREQTGL